MIECDYCQKHRPIVADNEDFAFINNHYENSIVISHNGTRTVFGVPIEYCPKCGRKLGDPIE